MIKTLLIDLDDTILDFHAAERASLTRALQSNGIEPTEERLTRYNAINKAHWELLEDGRLTREQVLVKRFEVFCEEFSLHASPHALRNSYENELSHGHIFIDGAVEMLESLYPFYDLYIASNGTARIQSGRIESADIRKYFKGIFISELLGANKPSPLFFDRCFSLMPDAKRESTMIVGDSMTSDIRGGLGAGIKTCLFNRHSRVYSLPYSADYEIRALSELKTLLEKI